MTSRDGTCTTYDGQLRVHVNEVVIWPCQAWVGRKKTARMLCFPRSGNYGRVQVWLARRPTLQDSAKQEIRDGGIQLGDCTGEGGGWWGFGRRTACAEEKRGNTTSEYPAVDHPCVLGAWPDVVPATAFWLFSRLLGDSICGAGSGTYCGTSFKERQARFGDVLVTGEEGFSAAELGRDWQIAGRCRGW